MDDMKKIATKIFRIFLWCVGVSLLLVILFQIMLRIPFGFVTTIDVFNNTNNNVYITPVGKPEGTEKLVRLRNQNETFKFSIPDSYHILLKANSKTRVNYDMDDIKFKFLIIETSDGRYYIKSASSPNQPIDEVHQIDDLQNLEECPKDFIPCTKGEVVEPK